jgi:transcriptional regulator with XRE-family HTH domain
MSDGLTGSRADWLSVWKPAAAARGYSYRVLDDRAGLTDGYFSRLVCGDIKEPTAETIAAINRALGLEIDVKMVSCDSLDGVGSNTK